MSPTAPAPTLPVRWAAYRAQALGDDLVAAVIVTILLVPQSLAYAMLAGLPSVVGVMASLLPILAYAALGSSTTLAVGPVAVLAMMTAQAITPVAQAHNVSLHLAAMVLAFEMGIVFLVAAVLRMDVFAALLSAPVLHGFMTGAAIMIALGQLPSLVGVAVNGDTLPDMVRALARAPALTAHTATAVIGLSALAALWAIRRYGNRVATAFGVPSRGAQLLTRMAPMFVVVAAIAWVAHAAKGASSASAASAIQGVALAGKINLMQGLVFEPLWHAPPAVWWALLPSAGLLGLVAYVESLAVAEALAARRAEKVVPRRELLGLAAANAAASMSGAMPVTGGFARSIVNFDAGARTRMAGVWTALMLALAVWVLGDVLQYLPKAVLAATIIVAVLSLVDFHPFGQAWRWSRLEFGLMLLVALLTVMVGVKEALAAGVVIAAGLLLQRTARPHWAEVGRLPGTEVFRNVKRFDVETLPGVLAVRIDESLLFTNSRWLTETLGAAPNQRPGLRHVVLMMPGVNDIDFTGLEGLMHLARELKSHGVQLHLSELKGPVSDRLEAAGLSRWLTGKVFRTQYDAHRALGSPGVDAVPAP